MLKGDLIWDLNEALNWETTAAVRNVLQLAVVIGADDEDVRASYRQRISLEIRHAQSIADLIVSLYGVPIVRMEFMLPPGKVRGCVSAGLVDMLETDVLAEQTQAREYNRLAALARAAGLKQLEEKMLECAIDKGVQSIDLKRLLNRVKFWNGAPSKPVSLACGDAIGSNGTAVSCAPASVKMRPPGRLRRIVLA